MRQERVCPAGFKDAAGEEFLGTGSSPAPAPAPNHYIDHHLLISSGDATARFRRHHRLGASYAAAAAVFPLLYISDTNHSALRP